jgi:hypothetical protein
MAEKHTMRKDAYTVKKNYVTEDPVRVAMGQN